MSFDDVMSIQTDPSSFGLKACLTMGCHIRFVLLYFISESIASLASGNFSKQDALKHDLRKTKECEENGSFYFK